MIRFLFGIILGLIVAAAGLSAVAVMNPKPDGPIAGSTGTTPEAAPAPQPETTSPDAATPDTTTPETTTPGVPETSAPDTTEPDTTEPESPESESAAPAPAPATAEPADTPPAAEPESDAATQESSAAPDVAPAPATATPQPATMPALTASAPGSPDTPAAGGADLDADSTATLGAPAVETGANAGIGGGSDTAPPRTGSAPTQIASSTAGTDSGPAVNTESAAVPQITGTATASSLIPGNAITEFAAPFDGAEGKPLMAIVLIDEGESPFLRPGMAALNEPVTFGVRADLPDSDLVSGRYRESGFEVTAVTPLDGTLSLSSAAAPEAVAQTLAEVFRNVPAAATLMDSIGGPLPSDADLARQVAQGLSITGHGLLSHRGTGVTDVPTIAEAEGVPSQVIFRVIDDQPGAANISQALDAAVGDAERDGGVIIVGHVRQETVATLSQWMFGANPQSVTIAPVSAVLTR